MTSSNFAAFYEFQYQSNVISALGRSQTYWRRRGTIERLLKGYRKIKLPILFTSILILQTIKKFQFEELWEQKIMTSFNLHISVKI